MSKPFVVVNIGAHATHAMFANINNNCLKPTILLTLCFIYIYALLYLNHFNYIIK